MDLSVGETITYLWSFLKAEEHQSLVSVALTKKPQMTVRFRDKTRRVINFDSTPGSPHLTQREWDTWARDLIRTWWSVSFPAIPLVCQGAPVDGTLIEWLPYRVIDRPDCQVYHTTGAPVIYWKTATGIYDIGPISPFHRGSFLIHSEVPLSNQARAELQVEMLDTPTGVLRLPGDLQESSSRTGLLALEDSKAGGTMRPAVSATADWLRQVLPSYKVGAPAAEDVRMKLALENRLRIEEKVIGSSRPLAFTVEAIDDTTFQWPGLWLIVGQTEEFRPDFPTLLVWDAVLAALAAATRMHVDIKPGLLYGQDLSMTILRNERRFSKRDVGETEGTYCLVNPTKLAGSSQVIAARLLQAASHELAHVVTRTLRSHPEVTVARRENLLLSGSELLPAISQLIELVGLHHRPTRPIPVGSVSMTDWLTDALHRRDVTPVSVLVKGWAAIRNLTEGRAHRDVEESLADLPQYLYRVEEGYVYNLAMSYAPLE